MTRVLGNIAMGGGLLIAVGGLMADGMRLGGYFVASLLVFIGIGMRLEAALSERPPR